MNEPLDPLEAELAALRPSEPSLGLRERIAEQLSARTAIRSRQFWSGAAAVALTAALTLAVMLLPRGGGRIAQPEPPGAVPGLPLAAAFDDALPTAWSFRRALSRSANDLDGMLDRHAGSSPESTHEAGQFRFFNSSDTEIHNLLGEL